MSAFWASNLEALSRRLEPEFNRLAERLAPLGPEPDRGLRNRSGTAVPSVLFEGKPRSLVSLYDAGKEAERWADVTGGAVALFGGAGTAAAQALVGGGASLLFWVEPRLDVWRSLLTWEDWTGWIAGGSWVPCAGGAAEWGQSLKNRYHPLWDGAFCTREWRPAVQGHEDLWSGHRLAVREALDSLASDNSTQARFAERWYRNALANLKRLEAGSVAECPGSTVVIAGAGPGLEDALADPDNRRWLEERPRTGGRLFSTDTAFPVLTAQGIAPDAVFCLDGQLPTYHHFVPGHPSVPLVADVCSIPLLGRVGMPVVRYLSGHPFGAVIRRHYPELPRLDGSLGNVSGLALGAALSLGAARVEAWGADFCYRDGQAYARGTYVYELAGRRVDRLQPWESRLGASCYAAAGRERTIEGGRRLDTTPLLREYKKRWSEAPSSRPRVRLAHGGEEGRWAEFASSWRDSLLSLPLPGPSQSMPGFVRSLPPNQKEDWLALWPLALALHRQGTGLPELPSAVVGRALSFLQD